MSLKNILEREKENRKISKIASVVSLMLCGLLIPVGVSAAENSENFAGGGENENTVMTVSEDVDADGGVYDFKDNKTTGTVTVTKVWDDGLTNDEREIPDIKISTAKPSKSTLGYTVTFHGNGLKFADGSEENMVVYNSAGEIVQGEYKMAVGDCVGWCTGKDKGDRVVFLDDGTPQIEMTRDLDLWAKEMTFEIKGNADWKNLFNQLIPSTVTEVIFTEEIKPVSAEVIDVDADGDGGVVAWTENNGTIMKVSTQIKGIKVQAAVNSCDMFAGNGKVKKIDLKMLDTLNVTNMGSMFHSCSGLTALDLSSFDTQNVTYMSSMFRSCNSLTTLDLSSFDTQNVTDMGSMFDGCSGLTTLDLSSFDTQKVTGMSSMFHSCNSLTSLDLSSFDTQKVTDMSSMFYNCNSLTTLDLSSFDTQKVTDMSSMFYNCNSLTTLDLSSFGTQNVTDMGCMFDDCSGLTTLDLSSFDTQNVTDMWRMFFGCSSLTTLDLSLFDTQKVTDMDYMFYECRVLKALDLSSFDTQKVTNMDSTFRSCSSLTTLDLSSFDTQNVTNMISMFCDCSGLTTLDLSSFDTQKVTGMGHMFMDCSGLTSLDLSSFDTQKVTNMYEMFFLCKGLTTLTTGTKFKFVSTNYELSGTWQNTAGETFTSGSFPSNVADTYTKIS